MLLLFFFSSRRRHTRFDCDWSSDVCSSDLLRLSIVFGGAPAGADPAALLEPVQRGIERALADRQRVAGGLLDPAGHRVAMRRPPAERLQDQQVERAAERSEERRVGKECRYRWAPEQEK